MASITLFKLFRSVIFDKRGGPMSSSVCLPVDGDDNYVIKT